MSFINESRLNSELHYIACYQNLLTSEKSHAYVDRSSGGGKQRRL